MKLVANILEDVCGQKARKRKKDSWRELIDFTENSMTADGFDEAVIGTVERFGEVETIVLYDKDKVIEMLMKEMPREEAEEYFYYNILGAYVGEGTPAFATLLKGEEDEQINKR
jgi:hypothetical protein